MLVDDYCVNRLMWPSAICINSVVVTHQASQLGVLQSPYNLSPPCSPPLVNNLGLNKSVPKPHSHIYFESKSD